MDPRYQTEQVQLQIAEKELECVSLEEKILNTQLIKQQYGLRPSHLYPVNIEWDEVKSEWMCKSTTIDLAGYGASPSEAMTNFDILWMGV